MQKKLKQAQNKKTFSRNQVFRIARIVALLKKNHELTPESALLAYKEMAGERECKISRSEYNVRTFYRDLKLLREDFDCPIEFDKFSKTYFLSDTSWELNCPVQLSESAMLALILGARIAEDIFPNPLRERIASAVDEILKGNDSEFMETALIYSLKVFAESGAVNDTEVFPVVFKAWQEHRRLRILYDDMKGGEPVERLVDPHVLFLYAREWRIKAYCHLRKAPRTFVISRICKAEMLSDSFEPDKEIIDSVTLDNIVSWKKSSNVRIRLTGDARKYAVSNQMHSRQTLTKQKDGSWLFCIPEVPEQVVVPWILSQGGDAIPLGPQEIVDTVRSKVTALHDGLKSIPQ